MAVKLGSTNISTIKLGSTNVTSAYLGSTLVFSSAGSQQQGATIFGEASGDNWGEPVSISSNGSRIAAGAFLNDGASGEQGGHVRAYYWTGTQWAQLGSDIDGLGYTNSPPQASQNFCHVAISGDGSRLVVGSHAQEFVKVFEYDTSAQDWVQLGSTISVIAEANFGRAVAIDSDGDTIVIGADGADVPTNNGTVRVYEYSSGTWSQVGSTITGFNNHGIGRAVTITPDGATIAFGSSGTNNIDSHVAVYENNSGTWSQVGSNIVGNFYDFFGQAVDISDSGTRVVIGAYLNDDAGTNNGQTQVYDFASGSWSQVGSDINGTSGAHAGYSVSITGDGTQIAVGAPLSHSGNGCTKVYELSSSTWSQVGSDIVSGGQGGRGVALSDSNNKIIVGATTETNPSQFDGTQHGAVRVYDYSSSGGGSSGGGSSGGGSSSYAISLISDGSNTYQIYAEIQLGTLPTGATGYKLEMTGTAYNGAFTGVVLAVLSPTNNTEYYVNTQAALSNNPSDNGPQNKNMSARFITATNRVKVYAHNANDADDVTVKVTPINNSYSDVGSASNQLTGIEIDEDG